MTINQNLQETIVKQKTIKSFNLPLRNLPLSLSLIDVQHY